MSVISDIKEAKDRNYTYFFLGPIQLTILPPEIGMLTQLTGLNLWNNYLTALPPEICALTQLKWLGLDYNMLTTFPPEIGVLTQLEHLNLGANLLTTLPPEIRALTKLTELYLHQNRLTTLPPETGALTQLIGLYLYNIPIKEKLRRLSVNSDQYIEYYRHRYRRNYFMFYAILVLDCSYPVVNALCIAWETN